MDNKTPKCRWCGIPVKWLLAYKLEPQYVECDSCWELRTRIELNPKMARKFLEAAEGKVS